MAGTIKPQYAASVAMTVSSLHSLAASSTWEAGWTSASVDNTTDEYSDFLVSGTFSTHASNRQAGVINVWAYASLNDTPNWPDIFSSGTEGSQGAATVTDTEERDAAMVLIASIVVDNTASAVYTFPPTSLRRAFGLDHPPTHWALFVSQNAATSTNAGLASSGSAIYYTPVHDQYT